MATTVSGTSLRASRALAGQGLQEYLVACCPPDPPHVSETKYRQRDVTRSAVRQPIMDVVPTICHYRYNTINSVGTAAVIILLSAARGDKFHGTGGVC